MFNARRLPLLVVLLALLSILLACSGGADEESATTVPPAESIVQTDPTLPPATDKPTATATVAPTNTPKPEPTSTTEPTVTPVPTATPEPTATETIDIFSFALVVPDQLGVHPFIDLAYEGAQRAIEQLDVQGQIYESNETRSQESALREAVLADHDLVVVLALDAQLVLDIAQEFPDQLFGAPSDLQVTEPPDNLVVLQLDVHESSFLAGLIAGMMTETKIVGAVVAGDGPVLNQFYWGYAQGVLEVCSDCQIVVTYLAWEFNNPPLGFEAAMIQFEEGADIIYQIASRTGDGVLQAAAETGNYAIGADINQDQYQPGHVLVSMLKRTDVTTYNLIEMAQEGTLQSGFMTVGLAEGVAGLSWDDGSMTFAEEGPPEMVDRLPDIMVTVEDYRQRILDGEYEVCDALDPAPVCDSLLEVAEPGAIDSVLDLAPYESAEFPFSIEYPSGWTELPPEEGVGAQFADDDGGILVIVEEDLLASGLGTMSLGEYVDLIISVIEPIVPDFQLVSREQIITTQGLTAEIITFTASEGDFKFSRFIYVHNGRFAFNATYFATSERYEVLQAVISQSYNTFRILP